MSFPYILFQKFLFLFFFRGDKNGKSVSSGNALVRPIMDDVDGAILTSAKYLTVFVCV